MSYLLGYDSKGVSIYRGDEVSFIGGGQEKFGIAQGHVKSNDPSDEGTEILKLDVVNGYGFKFTEFRHPHDVTVIEGRVSL
jgi:hypothetical protein